MYNWSKRSSLVVWTIVMPCFAASVTLCSGAYSLSGMQLLVSWQERGDATTFRRFWSDFTGCQCDAELSTSWSSWYSSRCETKPRRNWRSNAMQLITKTTLGDVIFVLPMSTSEPSRGPVLDWVTEVSLSLDQESGTFHPALCDSLTWTLDSSNNDWRHFCLSETPVHLWLFGFRCTVYKFIYLLTYLLTLITSCLKKLCKTVCQNSVKFPQILILLAQCTSRNFGLFVSNSNSNICICSAPPTVSRMAHSIVSASCMLSYTTIS